MTRDEAVEELLRLEANLIHLHHIRATVNARESDMQGRIYQLRCGLERGDYAPTD